MSTRHLAMGVIARAPVAGRCKKALAQVLGAAGAARLYACMLRDTLDARGRIPAARHVVFAVPEYDGMALLRPLVHAPWELVELEGKSRGSRYAHALGALARSAPSLALMDGDAPTVSTRALEKALADFEGEQRVLLGPCDDGAVYLLAMTQLNLDVVRNPPSPKRMADYARVTCKDLGVPLTELPTGYDVDDPAGLERLRVELAGHPERAPRTAQFLRENPP